MAGEGVTHIGTDNLGMVSLGLDLSARTPRTAVTVQTRCDEEWEDAENVVVDFDRTPTVDVVLVADNSGSQADYLGAITHAVERFSHTVLVREETDRAALVRASTEATVLQSLVVTVQLASVQAGRPLGLGASCDLHRGHRCR